jgi:RimJ/RimL family protein N-acetyltransferase
VIELAKGAVLVREWRETDGPELALQANDRGVWINLRDAFPHPYGAEDAQQFIRAALSKAPPTRFAIVEKGRIAGGVGYTLHPDVERIGAEVGYWLGREHWGRGIATTAVQLLTDHAFTTHAELRRLYAVPFTSNAASGRVLQKAGYRCEGTMRQSAIKDGRILDQWMYAIVRDEWEAGRDPGSGDARRDPGTRGGV